MAIDLFDESGVDLSFVKFSTKIIIYFLFIIFKTLEMLKLYYVKDNKRIGLISLNNNFAYFIAI